MNSYNYFPYEIKEIKCLFVDSDCTISYCPIGGPGGIEYEPFAYWIM